MVFDNSLSPKLQKSLVIHIDRVQLEEIVDEKLSFVLNETPNLKRLLYKFYTPVEHALIEFSLIKYKGNQFKISHLLGIHRNTLKKKIVTYNLNVKYLKQQSLSKNLQAPKQKLTFRSIHFLDLNVACRAKIDFINYQNKMPEKNILQQILKPVETKIIQKVLKHCKGNQLKAAKLLGIHRNTLRNKLKPQFTICKQ